MNKEFKESPFYPGKVIPVDYFMAREEEISNILHLINQSLRGRLESIFIQGERGIGKSSLADFISFLSGTEFGCIGAHCYLSGAKSIEDFTRIVFQKLINAAPDKDHLEKLKGLFRDYIKGFSLSGYGFGLGVEFATDKKELKNLTINFVPALLEYYNNIKDKNNGIILILDDLNGLSDTEDFSPFIKSIYDELAQSKLPFTLILVGLPGRRSDLIKHQPSIARIFNLIELNPFNDNETKKFFISNFNRVGIKVENDALGEMNFYSGGFPALMHEVGDAVFLLDKDGSITMDDSLFGILEAAKIIGRRYLDEQIINELHSKTYREILKRIGTHGLGFTFKRQELLELFSGLEMDREKRSIDNFIRKMKKLNVIMESEIRGRYKFVNELHYLYFKFHAFKEIKENQA